MSHQLEPVFKELGIAQYLDIFVEQGFDSWETILDIQESDLDVLGVKLGHRRKLQRRIANARGIAPSTSLASPSQPPAEILKHKNRPDIAHTDHGADHPVVAKRKYRRHPKADENGPERPPSAYVLFSNKLREGLKGQTLTFTEIAKFVGESWQGLSPAEREKYETQANLMKERYHIQMESYKRSAEYHQYMKYLQEFKEKQGKPCQAADESRAKGQEAAKRPKLDQSQLAGDNSLDGANAARVLGPMSIASTSSSERFRESESGEHSRRHESVTSVASATDSLPSSTAPKSTASLPSPQAAALEIAKSKRVQQRQLRRASLIRGSGHRADPPPQALPPISVLAESSGAFGGPPSADGHAFMTGFIPANQRHPLPSGPPTFAPNVMPSAHHVSSQAGSGLSTGKLPRFGRRSSGGPLAIQSLLSDQDPPLHHGYARSSSFTGAPNAIDAERPMFGQCQGQRGHGYQNPIAAFQHMKVEDSDGDVLMMPPGHSLDLRGDSSSSSSKCRLDGMSALLRAGEIVGRRHRD